MRNKTIGSLAVRGPFPWDALLAYLSSRMTPAVERIEGGCYVRSVSAKGKTGEVSVAFNPVTNCLDLLATGHVDVDDALARVTRLFHPDYDATPAIQHLEKSALLAPAIARAPGMRPPGAWSPFELCVRTILGQQVSVTAAGTLFRKVAERAAMITPHAVASANFSEIGMPARRVLAMQSLAVAATDRIELDTASWPEIDDLLRTLPGFGPWTRSYLAIRLGREDDAFPHTDLGLIRGAGVASPAELLKAAAAWQPYRGHAAVYLWSAGSAASECPATSQTPEAQD